MWNLSPEYLYLLIAIFIYMAFAPRKWWPFAVLMTVMTFMGVFRGLEVGTDHEGYQYDFYLINSWHGMNLMYHEFEVGYVGLILLFKQFSNDYLWFSGLTFLTPMIGTYYFVKYYRISPAWSLFMFFGMGLWFDCFNAMRQYMAICVVAAFTPLLKKREYKKFALITIILSVLIHNSTIIMLLLIPIFWYTQEQQQMFSDKVLYISIVTSFCVWFLGSTLLVSLLMPIMDAIELSDRFGGYIKNVQEELGNNVSILQTFIGLFIVYFRPKGKFNAETLVVVFYVIAFNVLNMLSTYAPRAAHSFRYYMLALIPMILYSLTGTQRRIFALGVIAYVMVQFILFFCISNATAPNPYTNWLFD